jgi:uncharacterized membrane protein
MYQVFLAYTHCGKLYLLCLMAVSVVLLTDTEFGKKKKKKNVKKW